MKLVDKTVKAGTDTNFQPEMHVTVAIPMQLTETSDIDQEEAEKMLAQQFIDILKQK